MPDGSQSLVQTLLNAGVDTCFCSVGTADKHLDSAFSEKSEFKCVPTLFEGVATGAADGYGRMAGKPAAMLSHYGFGLGNGQANLHNARKAKTPMINIVLSQARGEGAGDNVMRESDVEAVARNISPWVHTSDSAEKLPSDAVDAVAVATGRPTQISTLIVPEDVLRVENVEPVQAMPAINATRSAEAVIDKTALDEILASLKKGKDCAIMVGGRALQEPHLSLVAKIAKKSGARLISETFPARVQRGSGRPTTERLAYLAEMAEVQLRGLKHLIIVDTKPPVSFFAYPGKASCLVPDGCSVHSLVTPEDDIASTLTSVSEQLGATKVEPDLQEPVKTKLPKGRLTGDKACDVIAAFLPGNAIVSDESQTSGAKLLAKTAGCPKHDLLTLTGGAIGQGLPVAVGAAVACPKRPVIAMTGDGSAMYTIQSLSTMVQEQLDVTTIIFNNFSYAILNVELARVGVEGDAGPRAKSQLDLRGPNLDFVEIGNGMGMRSARVDTCENFASELQRALAESGPHLIEVVIPPTITGLKLKILPSLLNSLKHLPTPLARAVKNTIAP
ncbi:acetolactate synthase large subunit [Porticoccaceae bacterium]|nr:acetolactate synthase large subunit [Porticoccaceae bacterium]